jgi:hypothetical protein
MSSGAFEDDRAVRNVLAKYAYSLDVNDYEAVASCFTADASVSYQLMPEFPGGVVGFIRRGLGVPACPA